MTVEGGATLRQHLVLGERMSRRQVQRLHAEVPAGCEHIWGWFLELCEGKASIDAPLSYAEIRSWSELSGTPTTPYEVRCLKMLDREIIKASGGKHG